MKKVLDFLSILGYDGRVSLTNVALIALVTKIVISPSVDWPSVVAIVTAFGNYAHRRGQNAKQERSTSQTTILEQSTTN
jgi:hypothetical protein